MTNRHDQHDHDHVFWREFLAHGYQFSKAWWTTPFNVVWRAFGLLPADPRCEECYRPFGGPGGAFLKAFGYSRSNINPRYCITCDIVMRRQHGGAETELSMLFADVRGSTTLAEQMGTAEFVQHMNRFFRSSTEVLSQSGALIDKIVGDEVIGLYVPGVAGPDHARVALEAGQELLRVTGHDDPGGPWIPVGVGVHTGVAFVGTVGDKDGVTDLTALGDAVNIAARFASQAGTGEIITSQASVTAAGMDATGLEQRRLELKGKSEPVDVRVVRVAPA
jgi:adenylate cyclase